MISVTKLLGGASYFGDRLRYHDKSSAQKMGARPGSGPVVVWNATKTCNLECVHCYADAETRRFPGELTTEWHKKKRDGRILVDTARNTYAQTAVPPYAVRPRRGAPVATPIEWEELSDARLRPDRWNVRNVLRRLAQKGDPWADIDSYARGISRARRRVESLLA